MRSLGFLFASLGLLVAACDSGDKASGDKPAASASSQSGAMATTSRGEPKPEAKPLASLFGDKVPTIPSVYKGVTLGMTADEAKKLLPSLDGAIPAPEYGSARFWVNVSKEKGTVESFRISFPKSERAAAFAAWGPSKDGKDTIGHAESFWFNPQQKIRAIVSPGLGAENDDLTLTAYYPTADFLGDKGEKMGFEAPLAIVGATVNQLKAAYPKYFVEQTQAQADSSRKDLEKMMGKDKDKLKVLGKAAPSAYIDFPPTDFGAYFTRVNLTFDDKGAVKYFRTSVAFRDYPEAKDAILAAIQAKLGTAKTAKEYGSFGDPVMIFGKKSDIVVHEDAISKAWEIKVGKR